MAQLTNSETYRVNYGNGQVSESWTGRFARQAAYRELNGLEMYKEFAWVQRRDRESGEWVGGRRGGLV